MLDHTGFLTLGNSPKGRISWLQGVSGPEISMYKLLEYWSCSRFSSSTGNYCLDWPNHQHSVAIVHTEVDLQYVTIPVCVHSGQLACKWNLVNWEVLSLICKPVLTFFASFIISQRDPDPEFPTVTFPNPEEGKSALVSNYSWNCLHYNLFIYWDSFVCVFSFMIQLLIFHWHI